MTIPKQLLEKWKKLKTPGDAGKMAALMPNGYPEIFNRAFREEKCNDEVLKTMAKFYDAKGKAIKQYL